MERPVKVAPFFVLYKTPYMFSSNPVKNELD